MLEAHEDFDREFRGDTLHPAILEVSPFVRLYVHDFGLLGFASTAAERPKPAATALTPWPLAELCAGGALGAVGAVCIIYAFRSGGLPTYVMPLVFAGAPLVNVLFSMVLHPPKQAPNPLLYLGFLLAAAGAGMVLYFKPQS